MVDLKKLITGFLLLAVLMSSVIFIFSSFRSEKTEVLDLAISSGALKNSENGGSENKNPLFENLPLDKLGISVPLPDPVGGVADENPELPPVEDPTNLTDNLAQQLTEEMGTLDPSKGDQIERKTDEALKNIDSFASKAALDVLNKDLDSFDKEVEETINNLRIRKGASAEDVLAYKESVDLLLSDNFSRFSDINLEEGIMSGLVINSLEVAVNRVLIKSKDLPVPENLKDFHKSLVKLAMYQKKVLDLAQDQEDPLKSTIIIQLREKDILATLNNFTGEYSKIQEAIKSLGFRDEGIIKSIFSVLSVKKVYAQGLPGVPSVVTDPVHTSVNLTTRILTFAKNVATEFIKKRLVHQMVQQTINWIQGGGKPRFVQDFKGFALGEADKAVGGEIYKHLPQLCSSISPWVKSAFSGIGGGSRNGNLRTETTRCTLSEVIQNVENLAAFYENFGAGGWSNYLEVIRPQNNAFGSIMILSDIASIAGSEEKAAVKEDVSASGGLLSTKKCVAPNSHNIDAESQSDPELAAEIDNAVENGGNIIEVAVDYILTKSGETPVNSKGEAIKKRDITTRIFESCPTNGWQVNTPGSTVGASLTKAIGADLDWIVNAQDLAALTTAFIDSLVNKLFKAGVEGIAGASITKSPKQNTEDLLKSCNSFATGTPEYADCIDNANEIIAIYQNVITSSSTIRFTAEGYVSILARVIEYDEKYINMAIRGEPPIVIGTSTIMVNGTSSFGAIETINWVISECPYITQNNQKLLDAYLIRRGETLAGVISATKETAESKNNILWLNNFIMRLGNATDTLAMSELSQELENKFDSTMLSLMLTGAIDRYQKLKLNYYESIGIYFTNGVGGYRGGGIGIRCRF